MRQESIPQVLNRIVANCVRDASGCLIWQRAKDKKGYGKIWFNGRHEMVHRLVFEFLRDKSIPFHTGIVVHHNPTCSSKACCDFLHLNPMTKEEHDALPEERKRTPRYLVRGGLCKQGHPMVGSNLLMHHGSPECRTCKQESNNKSHYKLRPPRQNVTHCKRGHERTRANTFVTVTGARTCYVCILERKKARYARNKHVNI